MSQLHAPTLPVLSRTIGAVELPSCNVRVVQRGKVRIEAGDACTVSSPTLAKPAPYLPTLKSCVVNRTVEYEVPVQYFRNSVYRQYDDGDDNDNDDDDKAFSQSS